MAQQTILKSQQQPLLHFYSQLLLIFTFESKPWMNTSFQSLDNISIDWCYASIMCCLMSSKRNVDNSYDTYVTVIYL